MSTHCIVRPRPQLALLALVPLVLIAAGCAGPSELQLVSVAQEGGIRFTKITDDDDQIRGPGIISTSTRLTFNPRKFYDVSRDGNKLAYIGWKNELGNVYIKNPRSGSKSSIQRTFRDNVADVSFSPDGKQIAYSDFRDRSWNIYITNADAGSAIRQITTSPQDEYRPTFSPDGRQLVFEQSEVSASGRSQSTKYHIWGFNFATSSLTQYAEGNNPDFFPDGKKVAITRNNKENNNTEIWTIDLENGQEILIAGGKDRGYGEPAVSPDGTKIAYVSGSEGASGRPRNFDIFVMDVDGTNVTQLTFHPGDDIHPRWSTDSKSLYFLSQRGNSRRQWNVWRMDLQ